MKMKTVSYSQYSQWIVCPWQWKLNYIDGLREFHGNAHTIFGSAMHEVIQKYLTTMYTKTVKEADMLDLNDILQQSMKRNFMEVLTDSDGVKPCTKQDMLEFYYDGVKIIDFFKKKRDQYFNKRGYELLGIEIELDFDLPNNVTFRGYLDIVIKDTIHNKIKIYDIKTSTSGWNKWMKADKKRSDQLLLYKQFYSKQHDIPMDKIDVEFFIVKRKLYENVDWPQKRVQQFTPASGTPSINKVITQFKDFMEDCFDTNGEHRKDHIYRKEPSKKNCRWCEYNDKPDLCDKNGVRV